MFLNKLIAFALIVLSIGCHCAFSIGRHPYNRLILVESWPRSECCEVNPFNVTNPDCDKCAEKPRKAKWILHGLWPANTMDRYTPTYCPDPVKTINFKKYPEDLMMKMRLEWPYTKDVKRANINWYEQWKKYGTCMTDVPGMETDKDYFQKAIQLFELLRVDDVLARHGIVFKYNYSPSHIIQAVYSYLGHTPGIACNNRGRLSYLYGIHVCFDKNFLVVDCNYAHNCEPTVYLP